MSAAWPGSSDLAPHLGAVYAVLDRQLTVVRDVFWACSSWDAKSMASLMYGEGSMVLLAREVDGGRVVGCVERLARADALEGRAARMFHAK